MRFGGFLFKFFTFFILFVMCLFFLFFSLDFLSQGERKGGNE